MPRFFRESEKKAGAPPGLQVDALPVAGPGADICVYTYSKESFEKHRPSDINAVLPLIREKKTAWIQVTGLGDLSLFSKMGDLFNIHTLTLEDMVNPAHPPKFDDFDNYFFVILKQLVFDPDTREVTVGQISLTVLDNLLIFVQEKRSPCLDPVEKRLEAGRGRIRTAGVGYLAYALIDAVVDQYFDVITQIADQVESLEHEMLESTGPDHLEQIHRLKREMIFLYKQIRPIREMVSDLMKSESPLIPGEAIRFYADIQDHIIHLLDTVNSLRELLSGMLDFYLSAQGNRMNEVMATLTIISTIFIPLSFLAGIYGMNFKFMPELEWQWGYFVLLGVMGTVGGAMVVYFRKKGWF